MPEKPHIPGEPNIRLIPSFFECILFYEAFAQKLLEFKEQRPKLLEAINQAKGTVEASGVSFPNIQDKDAESGLEFPLDDIDPFTVFALFNGGTKNSTRCLIANALAEALEMEDQMRLSSDTAFEGIPDTSPQGRWFIGYQRDRKSTDPDQHWNLFEIADQLSRNDFADEGLKQQFAAAFDKSCDVKHSAQVKLSMALSWAFPRKFPTIDVNIREFMKSEFIKHIPKNPDGNEYLRIAAELPELTGQPFHELSYSAWNWMKEKKKKERDAAKAEATKQNVDENARGEEPSSEVIFPPYIAQDIIKDGSFHDLDYLEEILHSWRPNRNLILQGPPGTGKTWLAKRLAYALLGEKADKRIKSVQFHPNMAYEDFVRGYRPSGEGRLALVDGVFVEMAELAREDPDNKYVIVIEEINRGNPAMIFGELLTLIEDDKRNEASKMDLTYPDENGDKSFFVPPNLYVIGTMNIADRSLAIVDLAFRRRFSFVDLEPQINRKWLGWVVRECYLDRSVAKDIQRRILELNNEISDLPSLGKQFQIGHSFVTPSVDEIEESDEASSEEWFKFVVRTKIRPQLEEYLVDSTEELAKLLHGLDEDFDNLVEDDVE